MVCAIILAAGKSLRMGTQKLLLPFANQTVIGHIVDQVTKSSIRQTIVVTSGQEEEIGAAVKGKRVYLFKRGHLSTLILDAFPRAQGQPLSTAQVTEALAHP